MRLPVRSVGFAYAARSARRIERNKRATRGRRRGGGAKGARFGLIRLWYIWLTLVIHLTGWIPDIRQVMWLRGFLVRPALKRAGRNLQIASGVRITHPERIEVGDDVYFAAGCWIDGFGGLTVEDEVMFGPFTIVSSSNHTRVDGSYRYGPSEGKAIHVGRGSWTGAHVAVTAGVRIGRGVAIAAGSVVTKDTPDLCVIGGVPARVIRAAVAEPPQPLLAPSPLLVPAT